MLQIYDAVGNEYGKPKDVAGEQRTVFTSLADAAFDVCFENILSGCKSCMPQPTTTRGFCGETDIRFLQLNTSTTPSVTSSSTLTSVRTPRTGRPSKRQRS